MKLLFETALAALALLTVTVLIASVYLFISTFIL